MNWLRPAALSALSLVAAAVLLQSSCSGRGGPSPVVLSVAPNQGAVSIDVPISVLGAGFSPLPLGVASGSPGVALPRVFLEGTGEIALSPVSFASATELQTTVPAGITPGVYGLRVVNPDGKAFTLSSAYTAVVPSNLTVTGVFPRFGWTGETTNVEIVGGVFQSTPRAFLETTPPTELDRVAFLDSATLSAVVPAGITPGTYAVRVLNPDGGIGVLSAAFVVTATPPPKVDDVTASQGDNSIDHPATITGRNFPPMSDLLVEMVSSTGGTFAAIVNSASPPSTILATLPTSGLAEGQYLVRVTRVSDGAYGEYSAFTVTGPSGNPGPWVTMASLASGRRGLALAAGKDSDGNAHLYGFGGEITDTAGNVVTVFNDTVVGSLSLFGKVTSWRVDSSTMAHPRFEPVAWVNSGYTFVAGGQDASGAYLQDVDRAKILRSQGAPRNLAVTSTAGALAGGTWYYRVSAIVSDADNPAGETVPSDFAVITVPNSSGVHLSWTAPAEGTVTSYDVYRTPAVNGALGQERLLASGITGTTFVDGGTASTSAQAPKKAGALGVWVNAAMLQRPRAGATLSISRTSANLATTYGPRFVYVINGHTTAGVVDPTYEYAALSSNGSVSFALDLTNLPAVPRFEGSASTGDAFNAPASFTSGTSYVYLVGGASTEIDAAFAGSGGTLTWSTLSAAQGKAESGQVSVVDNNYVWFIGGALGGNVNSSVFSGRICAAGESGCNGGAPHLKNVNNTSSSLPDPAPPLAAGGRYQAGGAQFRGFIYVVGGSSDALNTVPDVEAIIF